MAERRYHHGVRAPARIGSGIVIPCVAFSIALAHRAAAQDEPTAPILANVHASWTAPAETGGYLDFFRGLEAQPKYEERENAALGIGGTLGFRPVSFAELHFGMDVTPRRATRDGERVSQTATLTSAQLRFSHGRLDRTNVPYVGLGFFTSYVTEPYTPTRPWPYTSAMWGKGTMLFGGLQRRIGARTALDIGLSLTAERVSRIQLLGNIEKDPHSGTTSIPRLQVGLSWLPPAPAARRTEAASSPITVGRIVRLHGAGNATWSGTVLATDADTVRVQSESGRQLRQIAVPWRCVTAIDVHSGDESRVRTLVSSAAEGLVAVAAAATVAQNAGEARIPKEPRRFALRIALPGAALGAVLGMVRNRYQWERQAMRSGRGTVPADPSARNAGSGAPPGIRAKSCP